MLSKLYDFLKYIYGETNKNEVANIDFQFLLITVKSLVPFEEILGCKIDTRRYMKEVELLECYKNGEDEALDYYHKNRKQNQSEDKRIELKIIPIVLSNTEWDTMIKMVISVVNFYTTSKITLLNAITISSAIFEYFKNEQATVSSINEITRDRVISFSLKEYYSDLGISFEKKEIVEFEKARIKLLSSEVLFQEEFIKEHKSLEYIFEMLNSHKKTHIDALNESILLNFTAYILKLRNGLISPDKLSIEIDNIPSILEFLENQSFTHPLLGRCKILKKSEKEALITTKSGLVKVKI